ncbi:MAG: hypothetical protein M0P66_09090 [Salinivirgaceae bacterium]|nr:hypothetical protein [Salinivirgaceae bacterium]
MKLKALFFTVGLLPMLLFAQEGVNPYISKSGKITYRYEFGDMSATYTLIFDDFGNKECVDIAVSNAGNVDHSRTVMTQGSLFVINYDEKQVMKFPLESNGESIDEYSGSSTGGIDLKEMVASSAKNQQAAKGQELVLGKTCQVNQFNESEGYKGKYWVWNGFVLKAEYLDENGEHTFLEAKEIAVDVSIPGKEFELPQDFEVVDMTETIEQMKKLQEMYGVPDEDAE